MLETRIRLNALVNAITELNIAWAIKPVATVKLFEALARVYASLSALVAGGLPLALPDYDHFRPSLALSPLVEKIAGVVSAIATAFKFIPFDETDGLFVVKVEAAPANRLLIGLKGGSEQVLESWIEGAMIASGSGFEAIRARRVLGAARTKIELSDLPEELAQSGYLIFEILNHGLSDDDCDLLIKNAAAQSAAYKPSEIVLIASMGEGETDDARPESSLG
jgi:type VI secretion system protein ImpJ